MLAAVLRPLVRNSRRYGAVNRVVGPSVMELREDGDETLREMEYGTRS